MGDDDRNTWLDQRAAERLLAGGHEDAGAALPPDDRDTAERLAELLDTAARAGRPALDTELPGEQAALAAFRAARAAERGKPAGTEGAAGPGDAAGGRTPNGHAANGHRVNGRAVNGRAANGRGAEGARPGREARPPGRRVAAEPVVRLSPAAAGPAPVRRTPRRLRRLRTAAAVAAAGCVLGGVALAAGAVLRSSPATPEPSAGPAISPTATTDPDRTGDTADEGAASAGGSRVDDRPEGRRDEPDTGTAPGGGADGAGQPDGTGDEDAGQGGAGRDGQQGTQGKAVERLCERFLAVRDGEEKPGDERSWNRLVHEAGGEKAVAAYCEKHFGDGARGEGGAGSGDHDRHGEDDRDDEGDEDD